MDEGSDGSAATVADGELDSGWRGFFPHFSFSTQQSGCMLLLR
jgi:hypothetical protein